MRSLRQFHSEWLRAVLGFDSGPAAAPGEEAVMPAGVPSAHPVSPAGGNEDICPAPCVEDRTRVPRDSSVALLEATGSFTDI